MRAALSEVARADDGHIHAVAVPWIAGKLVGGFDMLGVRADDANDRIPHQHRRSLRASWVLFAWLSVCDPGSVNTIDSYVEESGRRFVRHHFFDFGCAFGSSTTSLKGPHEDGEYVVEVGRTLAALFSLGLYRRPFQDRRAEWTESVARHPSLGYFPAESFDPDAYRSQSKLPAAMRMTDRDAYWGAKLVTAFSDEQIAAMVQAARLPDAEARTLDARAARPARHHRPALPARGRGGRKPEHGARRQPRLLRGPGDRARLRAGRGGHVHGRGDATGRAGASPPTSRRRAGRSRACRSAARDRTRAAIAS